MKRKSSIEAAPPEAGDFTGAGTPKPQSPVSVPQTFRLPQRLLDDLVRAGELRALSWLDGEGNTWLPLRPTGKPEQIENENDDDEDEKDRSHCILNAFSAS
jgi:hypothetical protein